MRIATCLLAAACLAGPATAADKITFRTLCFQHQGELKEVLATGPSGEGMIEVPLYLTDYSEPMQMLTENRVATFSIEDEDSEKPGPVYVPIAKVRLPATNQLVFLFIPNQDDKKEPYKVMALPDDARSFPWGGVRMINLAPVQVRFHLGEFAGNQAKVLKPAQIESLPRVRKLNEFNMYNVMIEFEGSDGFIPVSNTRWKCVPGKRDLAISYIDPASRKPVVKVYEDIQPAKLE